MGKSNRVRVDRADVNTKASAKKSDAKKTSRVYSITMAAIALFVVAVIVVSAVFSSGVIMRSSKAFSSENYTINGNMFTYMVMSSYEQFVTNYSSSLSYFGLDTSKPLSEQSYGDGTWLDYFVEYASAQAEQMLVYCEEANTRGIELDDEDKDAVDSAIKSLKETAQKEGYSLSGYLTAVYGKGVKEKDLRATFELSTLASKTAQIIDEEISDAITDEEIKAKYESDTKTYDIVDYLSYPVEVSYTIVAKEIVEGYDGSSELTADQKAVVLELYKTRIAEAKEKAKKFEAYADATAFLTAALKDVADESFDSYYKTEALATADKLSDADLATVKAAMTENAIAEVFAKEAKALDDTAKSGDKYTAYGVTLTEKAATAIDNVKNKLFTSLTSSYELYGTQKKSYSASDDFAKWAFDSSTKAGDRKTISTGDGSKDGEIKNESGYFSATVYYLESVHHSDTEVSKNVAYMSFETAEAAGKAADALKNAEKLDLEAFEAIAKDNGAAANGVLENYTEGQLTYNGFESWLYADDTKIGSYTASALPNAADKPTEYALFFYADDGDEIWKIGVRSAIFSEDYEELYAALAEKYPITTNDKIVAKVDF